MQFNSLDFMLFFPIVLFLYFFIPRRLRMVWLLIASYYFYMSWNAEYAVLIGGSTIITYVSALLLEKINADAGKHTHFKRVMLLVCCIVINLGILGVFKYGNFAIDSLNILLKQFRISTVEKRFDLLLPVGISFYTFQALGYIIDVYRGEIKAERNILRYALFVSFFPQLVAGPIERTKNLLPQLNAVDKIKLWNSKRITSGAIMMVWGYFMKMVIADRVAILVDTVFNNYRMYGSTELILAAIGFTIQIYCDFASYSIIAIGAAKIMGFDLMENFNTPYLAKNIRDFWDRWHISLSNWFKDYLYIPLGGSRKGTVRKQINILVVFLASGLWHGASWNYVIWGGIHGIYHVVYDCTKKVREWINSKMKVNTNCFSYRLLQTIITFVSVVFAWIFFRSDSITNALRYIKRIIIRPTPWIMFNGEIYNLGLNRTEFNILVFAIVILILVDMLKYLRNKTLDAFLFEQNVWFEWAVIIGLVAFIFVYGEYGPAFDAKQFIYFQF